MLSIRELVTELQIIENLQNHFGDQDSLIPNDPDIAWSILSFHMLVHLLGYEGEIPESCNEYDMDKDIFSLKLWAPLGASEEEFYQQLKDLVDAYNLPRWILPLEICAEEFHQKLGELIKSYFHFKQSKQYYQELEKLVKKLDESVKRSLKDPNISELDYVSASEELNQDLKDLAEKHRSDDNVTYEEKFYQKSKDLVKKYTLFIEEKYQLKISSSIKSFESNQKERAKESRSGPIRTPPMLCIENIDFLALKPSLSIDQIKKTIEKNSGSINCFLINQNSERLFSRESLEKLSEKKSADEWKKAQGLNKKANLASSQSNHPSELRIKQLKEENKQLKKKLKSQKMEESIQHSRTPTFYP